jgi:hypothetical protein
MDLFISILAGFAGSAGQILPAVASTAQDSFIWGLDLSIEGLRSQKFSRGIFVFLIVSLIIFSFIIYLYLPKGENKLKRGEKIMFGAMVCGMIFAVVLGYIQLIEGYLV